MQILQAGLLIKMLLNNQCRSEFGTNIFFAMGLISGSSEKCKDIFVYIVEKLRGI